MKLKCIGGLNNGRYKEIEGRINDSIRIAIDKPFVPIISIEDSITSEYEIYTIAVTCYRDSKNQKHDFKFLRHEKSDNDTIMLKLLSETFK